MISTRTARRTAMLMTCFAGALAGAAPTPAASPSSYVNIFVGTGGHGHTYPGVTVPFGFVQLSPDTTTQGWDGCSGCHYNDHAIMGFSHTHLSGTGCGDLGDVLIIPTTGDLQSGADYEPLKATRLLSNFSHDNESASPGYYKVLLDRYQVLAELTATAHAGLHRYTFPADKDGHVVIDLAHSIGSHVVAAELTADGDHRLTGFRSTEGWASHRSVYFVIESSRPWINVALEGEEKALAKGQTDAKGKLVRAAIDFKADAAPLVLRVGLSAVSVEEAQKNLDAEVQAFDFDGVHAAATKTWDTHLSRVTIDTQDPTLRQTFYSALYHTMVAPTLFNDADGSYRGYDGKVHTNEGFANYSTMSLWDTFRAENPLITLIEPERVNDIVRSALAFYQQSPEHALPMWPLANAETHCMIGYHAVPVIFDAYAKGFRDFDANLALQAMVDSATKSRNCPDDYESTGYVKSDNKKGSQGVARTMEYSYDDWCISQLAAALGKKDIAEQFAKRSQFFTNLFDSKTQFFRGRTSTGAWRTPFDPKAVNFDDYTEANAWQYAFFAPHNIPALAALYGGPEGLVKKLDAGFDQPSDLHNALIDVSGLIGQISHGNEPCHHLAYLYAMAGAQDRTAWRVRETMRMEYDNTPEGLCGNDDCGQMSAWYVWSAIGLYPLNPADGRYVIGSPTMRSATISLDPKFASGKSFTVIAHEVSAQNMYVQSAKLNGKTLERPWVTHDEIMHGGKLELEMGMFPAGAWQTVLPIAPPAKPYQISVDSTQTPELQAFADEVKATADTWYTNEVNLMRPNDPTTPTNISIVIDNNYDGVAETGGDQVKLSAKWFRAHPDDVGAVVHELAHVVQQYPNGAPGWFTEGFADYVRWFLYEPSNRRPHPLAGKTTYHDSYQTSAAFLNWVAQRFGQDVLLKVNTDCHQGAYQQKNWETYTGEPLEQIGSEWVATLRKK